MTLLENTKYIVKDSGIHGKGVFATKGINKEEVIGAPLFLRYYFLVNITEDLGKWINHSWRANAALVKVDGENVWDLVALEPIMKGDEITMDYRDTPWFIAKPSIWYR